MTLLFLTDLSIFYCFLYMPGLPDLLLPPDKPAAQEKASFPNGGGHDPRKLAMGCGDVNLRCAERLGCRRRWYRNAVNRRTKGWRPPLAAAHPAM